MKILGLLKAYQFLLVLALLIVNLARPLVSYFFRSVITPGIIECNDGCVNANYFVLALQLSIDGSNVGMSFMVLYAIIKSIARDEMIKVKWMVALKMVNALVSSLTGLAVVLDFLFSSRSFVTLNILVSNSHLAVELIITPIIFFIVKYVEKQRLSLIVPEVFKTAPEHNWIFLAPPAGSSVVEYGLSSPVSGQTQFGPNDPRSELVRVLDRLVAEMFDYVRCFEAFRLRHPLTTFRPPIQFEDYRHLI